MPPVSHRPEKPHDKRGRTSGIGRTGEFLIWSLVSSLTPILPLCYAIAPAFANHCRGSQNCPRLFPPRHPAADRGYTYACDWKDDVHWRCHTVRASQCTCDPSQERGDFLRARHLVQAVERCNRRGGSPSLVRNNANTDILEWLGVQCELPNGQLWTENHTTTYICYNLANQLSQSPEMRARVRSSRQRQAEENYCLSGY
jgi:hypothetical protein